MIDKLLRARKDNLVNMREYIGEHPNPQEKIKL
jgi:hypothetical protein